MKFNLNLAKVAIALSVLLVYRGYGQESSSLLGAAFNTGNLETFERLLKSGANPNQPENGEPLLHRAVEAKSFELARLLLWHGADVLAADTAGAGLLDKIKDVRMEDETLELQYLLRAHTLIRQHGRPATPVSRPNLVLVFEPTVDYTHPEIAPYYFVNAAELNGEIGVDDDRNGFVDDVYGWTVRHDRPHRLTPIQQVVMQQQSDQIGQLLLTYSKIIMGELTLDSPEVQALKTSYTNPVTSMFGRSMGFSDFEYMDKLAELSHGTHVAGIVIDQSKNEALVHNISWDDYGDKADWYLEQFPIPKSGSIDDYIEQLRAELLPKVLEIGRRGSDYIRATGAGVVNGSIERPFQPFIGYAQQLASMMLEVEPTIAPKLNEVVVRLAIELYAYGAIPMIMAVGENPNVLFVAAAGNSNIDNDINLQLPGYLSRFFPNLITVAAEGSLPGSGPSHFTNIGGKSVNVAAPGTQIVSYGIGGKKVIMNGTSQAAPFVAGLAAMVRNRKPEISAAQLRTAFESTVTKDPKWEGKVSSGGVVNRVGFLSQTLGADLLRPLKE